MHFHEVRFPASLSFGSVGGPERRTDVVTLANGFEERNSPWAHSRRRYDAGLGVRSLDDLAEVIAFFEARHGQLYGFRWKDWTDFKSCRPSARIDMFDQKLGIGDGGRTVFSLVKSYSSAGNIYTRPIVKPVGASVIVAVGGKPVSAGSGFVLDDTRGEMTFLEPPAEGEIITAGFEYDVPVRFDTDRITTSLAGFAAGEIPSIPIMEVRV